MKTLLYKGTILIFLLSSCQKEFLSKSPDRALLVPTTLADFESLLDNTEVFNVAPSLQIIASDDFYGTEVRVNSYITPFQKNSYLWADDIDEGQPISDWNVPYEQVFYSNVILEGLENLPLSTNGSAEFKRIKGSALFHRAFALNNLVQMYAKPYDPATSEQNLGIPLRLKADVNIKSTRSNLKEVYQQIINDLKKAEEFLPITSSHQNRPNKIAAKALLARIYLSMEDYENALKYSSESLLANSELLDYNTLSRTSSNPFPVSPTIPNPEVIFYSRTTTYTFGGANNTTVSNELYQSYHQNDLRRSIFFTAGNPAWFKGRYTGNLGRLFGGIARDEIYLIKAECEARVGDFSIGVSDLNNLLRKRWLNTVTYIPISASSREDALTKILVERRKELVFRGLRWGDLRRLNKDPLFAKTIIRTFDNVNYSLEPRSNKYTFPIPTREIQTSGIEQNER